jgi:hypothetical protein
VASPSQYPGGFDPVSQRKNGASWESGAAATTGAALPLQPGPGGVSAVQEHLIPDIHREPKKAGGHREAGLFRDSIHFVERDGITHVISEDYSYKSEPYYAILNYEMRGKPVWPSSSAVLDAYVVPMCLERARLGGIPVCQWEISQGYVPLPSIIYGLNYFATSADFAVVRDGEKAKEVTGHVTNKGKYPFCYQKIPMDATIHTCVGIFGRTTDSCSAIAGLSRKVYETFAIPLVTMVFVRTGGSCLLSSLAPTRFSRISASEKALLSAYLAHQEFL